MRNRFTLGTIIAMLILVILSLPAMATHVTPQVIDIPEGTGQPTCEDLGYDSGFKIDSDSLVDGTYGPEGFEVEVTFSGDDGGQPTSVDFDVVDGSALVNAVFVKGGQDGNLYDYGTGTDADTGLTAPDGKGISHVNFCYNEPEEPSTPPSTPPSEPPSTPPSEEPSTPPSEEPSTPPSEEPSAPPSEEPSTPPEEPSTPPEEPTTPPTDMIGNAVNSGTILPFLMVLAVLVAIIVVLTPRRT